MILQGMVLIHNNEMNMIGNAAKLVVEEHKMRQFIQRLPALVLIPIFDAQNQRVDCIQTLTGRRAEPSQNDYPGFPVRRTRCILDEFSDPIEPIKSRRKYLLYEPRGSWTSQIKTFINAHVFATELNRTLITPPFISSEGAKVDFERFFSWNVSWAGGSDYNLFPFKHFPIKRHAVFRTRSLRYDLMDGIDLPIARSRNVSYGMPVMIPTLWGTDGEAIEAFGDCIDPILVIKNFNDAIEQFDDEEAKRKRREFQGSWTKSPRLEAIFQTLIKSMDSPIFCTIFSRGNGKIPCGMDISNNKHMGLLYFRSCQASPTRTIDYAVEAAQKFNMAKGSVYVIEETPFGESLPMTSKAGFTVYTMERLEQMIKKHAFSTPLAPGMMEMIAQMLEREICKDAPLFVTNIYSPMGKSYEGYRKEHDLITTFLGK